MTYSVVDLNEGVVDSDDVDGGSLDAVKRVRMASCITQGNCGVHSRIAEDDAANTTETVDTNLRGDCQLLAGGAMAGISR